MFDLIAAYSFDGGLTFTSNHRISTASSLPDDLVLTHVDLPWIENKDGTITPLPLGTRAGLIGEYIGVTAYHDKINAVWTDSRDGNSEVYTANWYLPLLEPRLSVPANNSYVTTSLPLFHWATAWKHNEDRYRVELSTSEAFTEVFYSSVVDTNMFIADSNLSDGVYFWRVKSFKNTTLDSSDYSPVWSFEIDTTHPDAPEFITPPDGATLSNLIPYFEWTAVVRDTPVTYTLAINWSDIYSTEDDLAYSGLTEPYFQLTDSLPADIEIIWSVKAVDNVGNESSWISHTLFTNSFICGDIDGNGSDLNVADLVYLVNFMFQSGPPPSVIASADMDGSFEDPDIVDLVYMVTFMFENSPEPDCP
ncbi:MAG: hypothetical protein U9R56_01840 [candidate division Zixibacteria bacterium]|nr:hypothetical protein [candidate division Zixibacteria bacterium]